jgi:predicted HTH domain antitoxin
MPTLRPTGASNKEGKILLAIQAYKRGQISSLQKAAALYAVPLVTLYN